MQRSIRGMGAIWRAVSFSVLLLGPALALANTAEPDTPLEDVQTVAEDDQAGSLAILSDAVGNVLTLHEANDAGDDDPIIARRFPADGPADDEPVVIDTLTDAESRLDTDAAMNSQGAFILVWNELPEDDTADDRPLVAQHFNPDLEPMGDRIVLTANATDLADVDLNDNGDFVAAWSIDDGTLAGAQRVQRFDATGTPTSDAFTLVADDNELVTDVAIAASGAFVASYTAEPDDSDTNSNAQAFFRLFDAQGEPVGDAVQANTDDSDLFRTAVDMTPAGEFVMAWGGGDPSFIHARRFDADGQPQGAPFQINLDAGASEPLIALDAYGRFVVIWAGADEVFARRFSASGVGAEVTTLYDGQSPQGLDVVLDADGDYAAIWTEASDTSPNKGVYARRVVGPETVDLAATLVASSSSVAPGGTVEYQLTVDNNHDPVAPVDTELTGATTLNRAIGAATGVTATFTLPSSLSGITLSDTAAPSGRTFDCDAPDGKTLTCTLEGGLYAGESLSARVSAQAGDALQTVQTDVLVSANQFDSDEASDDGNNRDSASVTVTEDGDDSSPGNGGSNDGASDNDDDDGSSGGGCTLAENTAFDPTLLLLLACAATIIVVRRRDRARR